MRAARALGAALVVAWGAATLGFALVAAAPGAPLAALDAPGDTPERRAARAARAGVGRPIAVRYAHHLASVVRGDLGWSYAEHRPVAAVLGDALPASARLATAALAIALAAGLGVALLGARAGGTAARAVHAALLAAYAVPPWAIGVLLLGACALRGPHLPTGGALDPLLAPDAPAAARLVDALRHLALPAITLGLSAAAAIARHQRALLADALASPWALAATARGLPPTRLLVRHALRATLGTAVQGAALLLPAFVGGAVVVEALFAWPGLGLVASHAVAQRDAAVFAGVVLVAGVAQGLATAVATWAAPRLDPRLAAEAEAP